MLLRVLDLETTTVADEIWRPVVGYEGRYEVSSAGRIRSLGRTETVVRRLNNGKVGAVLRTKRDRFLAPALGSNGYFTVRLCGKTFSIHGLVLTAFAGPRPTGMEGCHGDGVRTNNCLQNLRWDTPGGNWSDRRRHEADRHRSGTANRELRLRQAAGR